MPSPKNTIPHLEIYPNHGKKVAEARGLHTLKYIFLPRHVYLTVKSELQIAALRLLKSRRVENRFHDASDLLVNLGAGPKGKEGWINVDVEAHPGVNCVYDCRKKLPFPNDSVRGIFCEHFFEHLEYTEEVPHFLSECHRVLKPGGNIRLIVPDLEAYVRAYCSEGWMELEKLRELGPNHKDPHFKCHYNTRMELLNMLFRQGSQHKFGYDYDTLAFLLGRFGFKGIKREKCSHGRSPELCIDDPSRAVESLYLEASK
jgi:predicted SAM-dependent methyltransferase